MVQIDIFWSYGFGASYAIAASRILQRDWKNDPKRADAEQFYSKPFVWCLLYLSLLFAPSGAYLLWAFPDWETMMVADTHQSLPAWLVTGFAFSNITQGILGYYLTRRHIVREQHLAAFLHLAVANFLFYFVLLHGWDGSGYQRFLSETRADFLVWQPQHWQHWLGSGPMLALLGMGLIVVPVLFFSWAALFRESAVIAGFTHDGKTASAPEHRFMALKTANGYLGNVFVCGVGCALLASVLIHLLGWLFGALVFAALLALLGFGRHGFIRIYARHLLWQ